MTDCNIHPTAIIDKGAQIGKGVTVEPYAVIGEHVILKDGVTVRAHAYLDGHLTVGENTVIYPSAVIGTKAQHLRFNGEKTTIEIGKNCEIREFVTINSSVGDNGYVKIGDNCFIMAYCHIAHNCVLGNNVIMSNNSQIAGHVVIGNNVVMGGFVAIHQFVRVGDYSMIGGVSALGHDMPPYTLGGGIPFKIGGLNIVGLKRNQFSLHARQNLSRAFRLLYRSKLHPKVAIERIENELDQTPEILALVQFFRSSKRGLYGLHGVTRDEDVEFALEEELATCE
ncbi:MAG: acyl-ACP--UDP-N-acetylglucosamine O-acyltransferase [Waddliaceae bacterium]